MRVDILTPVFYWQSNPITAPDYPSNLFGGHAQPERIEVYVFLDDCTRADKGIFVNNNATDISTA